MDRPKFARKDVRALADWLTAQGWEYAGNDSREHTLWTWPATGQRITLPGTPHGSRWQKVTRAEACKIMGIQLRGKRHRRPDASRAQAEELERRRAAERAAILARREAEAARERAARASEARRRQSAQLAEIDYRREMEIRALMQPGGAR